MVKYLERIVLYHFILSIYRQFIMFYSENATKTLHSRTLISKHKNVPKSNLFTMNLFCCSLSVNSLPDSIFWQFYHFSPMRTFSRDGHFVGHKNTFSDDDFLNRAFETFDTFYAFYIIGHIFVSFWSTANLNLFLMKIVTYPRGVPVNPSIYKYYSYHVLPRKTGSFFDYFFRKLQVFGEI